MINDEQVGRSVDETLRVIKAFQHADEHGVVCPANWNKGDPAIIPSNKGIKNYLNSLYKNK